MVDHIFIRLRNNLGSWADKRLPPARSTQILLKLWGMLDSDQVNKWILL